MNLYTKILVESKTVNGFWKFYSEKDFTDVQINFGKYKLRVEKKFDENIFPINSFFIFDKNLYIAPKNSLVLISSESQTKNIDFITGVIEQEKTSLTGKTLVAVGGGVILDTALTIACLLKLRIILVPTSVLSMSDSSIGGKARANKIEQFNDKQVFIKHFFREFYDPSEIVICGNFLETIPDKVIPFNCAEIIKHAFFQSDDLLHFLLSEEFQPFSDRQSLLKAILWTADLKRVCMEVDPQESYEGSKKIIREGHVMADKLEKESGFTMSHGEAVLRGIKHDLENELDHTRLDKFTLICEKLKISF